MAPMRFRNFGGIYQFVVADEEDLARIDDLDPARWAATSAPLRDLHCDPQLLKYVDAEGSGRVRVDHIIAARDWLFARLARRGVVKGGRESVALDALATDEAGDALRTAAGRVNEARGASDRASVSLADVRAFKGSYATMLANGDGVVPPELVPEADVAHYLKDVMATVGSAKDRGGAEGVSAELLAKFRAQGLAWLDWRAKAAAWDDDAAAAAALVARLDPKVEAYFIECDLVRQERAPDAALALKDDELRALRARDPAAVEAHLAHAPLTAPDPSGVLDLGAVANVVYRDDLAALRPVAARALGDDAGRLTRASWRKVRAAFEGFAAWEKAKPADPFDKLGAEPMVRALVEGPLHDRAAHYAALDAAAAPELERVDDLEKLLLYVRWLVELANNFVNFSAIYRPTERALVEMGSLVIDGRRLEFCVNVADRAAHKAVAGESLIFLVYAAITDKDGAAAAFEVVAPVTAGEKGRLRAGKRGVFYANDGKVWDARVTEVVENPISVREAMFAPFRRASKFVGDKIEKWIGDAASAQEEGLQTSTASATVAAQQSVESSVAQVRAPPPAAPVVAAPARPGGFDVNSLVVGGGLALAGLGAVLAGLFGVISTLSGWLAILGVVSVVLALSALNAWLKLRRRDLSVVLEANGWAVNVHTLITARIARVFAFTPDLPKDRVVDARDMLPGGDDEGGGGPAFVLLLLIVAAAVMAYFGRVRWHWF